MSATAWWMLIGIALAGVLTGYALAYMRLRSPRRGLVILDTTAITFTDTLPLPQDYAELDFDG